MLGRAVAARYHPPYSSPASACPRRQLCLRRERNAGLTASGIGVGALGRTGARCRPRRSSSSSAKVSDEPGPPPARASCAALSPIMAARAGLTGGPRTALGALLFSTPSGPFVRFEDGAGAPQPPSSSSPPPAASSAPWSRPPDPPGPQPREAEEAPKPSPPPLFQPSPPPPPPSGFGHA